MFDHISGHCGLAKLVHKINHHVATPCQLAAHTHLLNHTPNKDSDKVIILLDELLPSYTQMETH